MKYDLSKVHAANLSLLKEIDRICQKYQIAYLLDAGTLLGAVRHQGFIPWDDDVDLAFTRENYERFISVVEKELRTGMSFLDYRSFRQGTAFYDYTSRIIYDKSRMHEETAEMDFYEGKLNHLWVDLFVLDRLPDHKVKASMIILLQKILYGLAMGHRYQLDLAKYQGGNRFAVRVLAGIGKCLPLRWIFACQQELSVKGHKRSSQFWYYSNYQPDYLYVRVKDEWCRETVHLDFCDTQLMAPSGWDEVLHWIYGDYRELPPIHEQVPAHSSIAIEIYD